MWFDSHCHLHLLEEHTDLEAAAGRARAARVSGVLTVGIDRTSSARALAIARAFDWWSSAGVHPNSAVEWSDEAAAEIDDLLADERVVAVGETGLDYYRDEVDPVTQQGAFEDHIALAKKHDKALVIHTRESTDAVLETLERTGAPGRLVFHCWSGDEAQLGRALDLGSHISFAGNVTFKNAGDLRVAAHAVPSDRILIETDAPFLAPVPHRGGVNEPAFVAATGTFLAKLRGEEAADFAALVTANARTLFGLAP